MAILSRSFCDIYKMDDVSEIERLFKQEMVRIRDYEKELELKDKEFFLENQKETSRLVDLIADKIQK